MRKATIIGGSMSGLLAGLRLRQAGFTVDVFERVEGALAGRGAGIVAQPSVIRTLQEFGRGTHDLGVPVQKRRILNRDGEVTGELDCPQMLTSWERVHGLLRELFGNANYHAGRVLDRFEPREGSVVAHFADGESIESDLLIGADGFRSTVREQCLPGLAPRYAGYIAWRALVPEAVLPANVLNEVFGYFIFGLPPGEQFLVYPVAGPDNDLRVGHRRLNMIWYRPAEESSELKRLLTDESGKAHSVSIPPPLISRESIAGMRDAAERLLAPQFREVVRLIEEPILQPIYDLEVPRMVFDRVALVGDAAFVVRPHVGAGVSKAADDASALARALKDVDIVSGLQAFEHERLPVGRQVVEYARHLGSYLQATKTQAEAERAGRHSTDEAVMAETALVEFLEA